MPKKDIYHDAVVYALRKDDWITREQITFTIGIRRVWVDIQATQSQSQRIILVEVKSFYNLQSQIEYFAHVVGKYLLYRAIIDEEGLNYPLYLAAPKEAYEGFLSEQVAQLMIKQHAIKLLIFDIEAESIVQWIE